MQKSVDYVWAASSDNVTLWHILVQTVGTFLKYVKFGVNEIKILLLHLLNLEENKFRYNPLSANNLLLFFYQFSVFCVLN